MARPGPTRSGDHRNWAADREQRLGMLRLRAQETARKLRTADDWTRCLQAAARLSDQSWANVLLIASRIPQATQVRGYEAWRSAGRQVIRGEKGIEIFSTNGVTNVWDLSQTGGAPVPATVIPAPPGEAPPGLWDCLCWLAIAITLAGQGRYVGLAPCGTAFTGPQAEALSRSTDLRQSGILVAFDDDAAGRKAAVRVYPLLHAVSDRLGTVSLSGKDPAEVLESEGPAALRAILQGRIQPLSALVIDAHLEPWERRLRDPEGTTARHAQPGYGHRWPSAC